MRSSAAAAPATIAPGNRALRKEVYFKTRPFVRKSAFASATSYLLNIIFRSPLGRPEVLACPTHLHQRLVSFGAISERE